MVGVQAEGAAPIAHSIKQGLKEVKFVENPETVATAIRIGSPVNWKKAVNAVKESHGLVETVSDSEILEAQRLLAQLEGLFVEPASAASVAGLIKLAEKGFVEEDEKVVCVLTGHGLKDPEVVLKRFPAPVEVEATSEAVEQLMVSEATENQKPSIIAICELC
jgi:threonine synthase